MTTLLTIAVILIVFFILFKIFKVILRIILVLVFLGLAYLSNPDPQKHHDAVNEKARKTNTHIRPARIHVSDYKIFSLTYIKDENEDGKKLVGAGAFTRVWIFRNL